MRAIRHRRVLGMGALYQGRFKSLPVERDEHLATLLRYVQRNPVRANLVKRDGEWKCPGGMGAANRAEAQLGMDASTPRPAETRGEMSYVPFNRPPNAAPVAADLDFNEVSK